MKTSEIRQNDWVAYNGNPSQIVYISCEHAYLTNVEHRIPISDLRPIRITEEILNKNRWHKKVYTSNGIRTAVYNRKGKGNIGRVAVCFCAQDIHFEMWQNGITTLKIKYLHQLQHLLWALGIDHDLEI